MPTTIKNLEAVLKAIKIPDEEISKLIATDGEIEISIPETVKIFSADEYTQLETNLKKGTNETSRKAGIEIALKKIKEETGVDMEITADTDLKAFAAATKTHILNEAKVEPNKAKEQWDKEKSDLQKKIEAAEKKAADIEADKENISFETTLLRNFPAKRSMAIDDNDKLLLIKSKLSRKKDGESEYFEYDGKRLQDKLNNDLKLPDAINHIFEAKKWIGEETEEEKKGRGGGSDKGKGNIKPLKRSEAIDAWNSNTGGINPDNLGINTAEYQAYQTSLAKENKEFSLRD